MAVILVVATVSAICFLLKDTIGYRLVSFILLFVVSILAVFFGTGPILLASTLSAGIWNYFFIPPSFTLHIGETEDTLLLVMFFVVALLNGILTSRIRRQELNTRKREERTLALYQLSKELLTATGLREVVLVAEKYFKQYFDIDRTIFFGGGQVD
jgi:two-component system sensor histidine kinase KdpD